MEIHMIGIDHHTAGVKIRERFSFTSSQAERAVQMICREPCVSGCVLLSTCNRTELYVSMEEDGCSLPELLISARQLCQTAQEYEPYFQMRKSQDAVRHLFYLTAGLKSRILGEDQILAQVKEAVKKSRELCCMDTLLEVLFRQAVTAGKEIKSKVLFTHADVSVVHSAVAAVTRRGLRLEGKNCLVIGNGQMGKLAAEVLRDAGASVTVTVRQYRSGIVEIPKGCGRIHYGERYQKIAECDLIVSATRSPNVTVRKEPLAQARLGFEREQIFIDLAVPRDIEEEIAQLKGVTLYNIDAFQDDMPAQLRLQKQAAEAMLEEKIEEFKTWYACRALIPRIQQIGRAAAEETSWRMRRGMGQFPKEDQESVDGMVKESVRKVVDKMLYALRDGLSEGELQRCLEILEQIRYE